MSLWSRPKRWAAAIGAVAALSIAAVVIFSFGGNPEGPQRQVERLVIADANQPVFALIYIADAKGFFKDERLDVQFNKFVLGRDALASAIEGKSDIATVFETPVVTKLYEGNDLAIVSTLHTSTRGQAVIARRDRGISRPSDLRGKRIGVSPGTSMDYLLTVFLATEGIAPSGIRRVPLEPLQYESALLGGAVDALVAFSPHPLALSAKLGEKNAVVFYSDVYVEMTLLAGRRDVVTGRKEAMARLVRAIVRAQDFAERNPEESIAIVAARPSVGLSETSMRQLWGTFRPEAKLDNLLLTLLVQEGHWLRESGRFSTPPPDFAKAIVPDYLRSAKPSAVTILGPSPSR